MEFMLGLVLPDDINLLGNHQEVRWRSYRGQTACRRGIDFAPLISFSNSAPVGHDPDALGGERIDRMAEARRVQIAALADLHYGSSAGRPMPAFSDVAAGADVLLLCGDLTDRGLPEEAQGLMKELSSVKIPIVAVLGNHDFESDRQQEVRRIFIDGGIKVLDGEACEIADVGFAGVKGFAGGFGRRTLEPWGERVVKAFIQEAVEESLKLQKALAQLRTRHLVAVL